MKTFVKCIIDDCQNNSAYVAGGRRGLCNKHRTRVLKHGNPNTVIPVKRPAQEWLEAHKNYSGDDCLIWPFHISKDGYARAHHPVTMKLVTASRLMCIMVNGDPGTSKIHAAHTCGNGNKGCVNPRHLYWATCAQNMADRVTHETSNRGERQWQSRLKEPDVLQIVELLKVKSQAAIAKQFGVDPSHISTIASGKRWGWLTGIK